MCYIYIYIIVHIRNLHFSPLKTKRNPLYLKAQIVPRSKHSQQQLYKQINYCRIGQKSPYFSEPYETY